MNATIRAVPTFPSIRLPSYGGGLPVEVALIAQLGPGAGTPAIELANARQRGHENYVDALDEPSARIGGMDLAHGDATSLYSFSVGRGGHPFHRHAGHRVFTALAGSGGARLRFSTASDAQIAADPQAFVRALRHVDIAPDCLFTVRFGGGTWHQFVPLQPKSKHPALFALSCHTNELGGDLPPALRERVLANAADIPSLTQVLPPEVEALLGELDPARVETYLLALEPRWQARLCALARDAAGRLRAAFAGREEVFGYLTRRPRLRRVRAGVPAADSLLRAELRERFEHEDSFTIRLEADECRIDSAQGALAALLEGFMESRPAGVSRLMQLRNALVRPLGLRVSPLGCPVSSLLSKSSVALFAGRFPVLQQGVNGRDVAQVVLGADDRHLRFRSCVGVRRLPGGVAELTLETRVQTLNAFGRFYLAMIDAVHRRYVTPSMLRAAVEHVIEAQARRAPAGLSVLASTSR
jgi:hypothetical protein